MCHPIATAAAPHHQSANSCAAKQMAPDQRQALAVQALAGSRAVTHLAEEHDVSRKFVYQQANKAETALDA